MKSIFTFLFLLSMITSAYSQTAVDVVTGASYADEVYYNLESDVLKTVPGSSWDIAFNASQYSVSVLANNGREVKVYTWPKGAIGDWETVDTTGMAWTPMYNSIVDWEEGAFNRNATTHPDYGWGIYNMANHNIYGDSIFIIKLANGNFKKFAIPQKNSNQNVWSFKYADLDGQNDTTVNLNTNDYKGKSFIHYSIANNAVVDQEPAERWQLLFTRYYDFIPVPYRVTGALSNNGVKIQQVNGVSQSEFIDYNLELFNDTISQIGSDWKSFSFESGWNIDNSVVYFVQDTKAADKSIWKLYFTGFSGSATGTYSFVKEKLGTTGLNNISERNLTVYPNPASREINVIHDFSGATEITIYNISGQPVFKTQNFEGTGLNKNTLNISTLPTGMYSLHVRSGNEVKTVKFLKK